MWMMKGRMAFEWWQTASIMAWSANIQRSKGSKIITAESLMPKGLVKKVRRKSDDLSLLKEFLESRKKRQNRK